MARIADSEQDASTRAGEERSTRAKGDGSYGVVGGDSFLCSGGHRFVDRQDLVCADVLEGLRKAAGPANLDGLGGGFRAETKVDALITGRKVAASGRNRSELWAFRGDEFDFGADRITIALVANQLEQQPVVLRWGFVVKNVNRA